MVRTVGVDPGPYTVAEVCTYLRLSEPKVLELLKDGRLRAKRAEGCRKWLITWPALQEFLGVVEPASGAKMHLVGKHG